MNKGPQKPDWTHWISPKEVEELNATFDKEHAKEIAEIQQVFIEPKEVPGYFYGTRPALEADINQAKLAFENAIKEKTKNLEAERQEMLTKAFDVKWIEYTHEAQKARYVADIEALTNLCEDKARRKTAIDQADLLPDTYLSDQCKIVGKTLKYKWGKEEHLLAEDKINRIEGFTQEGKETLSKMLYQKQNISRMHERATHSSLNPEVRMTRMVCEQNKSKTPPTRAQLSDSEKERGRVLITAYYKEIAKTQKDNPNNFSVANKDGEAVRKPAKEEAQITDQVAKMKI